MSTSFQILPTAHTLPNAPSLHLLPLALGPSNTPYASTSAPTQQYFRPRLCPPELALQTGIPQGTPLAAFRGRQLIGHDISIPPGYRGVILGTGKRPDRGGLETRTEEKPKYPLTPATSVSSFQEEEDEGLGLRRSPRKRGSTKVRGAGQVALAKPKVRQVKVEARKRFRLDSDEDSDDSERAETPKKRAKISSHAGTPVTPAKISPLPEIVVVAPTPLKEPLPPPIKVLPIHPDPEEILEVPLSTEPEEVFAAEVGIIPSPATEDDPPNFDIESLPVVTSLDRVKEQRDELVEEEEELSGGNARILKPLSSFSSFTLWAPDVPIPGFRPDELAMKGKHLALGQTSVSDEVVEKIRLEDPDTTDGYLDKGWWRVGGGGEGGDEFVRGLGEWLGLVEEVRLQPSTLFKWVYLF